MVGVYAGSKKNFKKVDSEIENFVDSHVNQNSRAWVEYEIDDKDMSRIRPSQKQKAGKSVVVTWEIKT